jgi:hypothetical protein
MGILQITNHGGLYQAFDHQACKRRYVCRVRQANSRSLEVGRYRFQIDAQLRNSFDYFGYRI